MLESAAIAEKVIGQGVESVEPHIHPTAMDTQRLLAPVVGPFENFGCALGDAKDFSVFDVVEIERAGHSR
jgi:hypothetical protein